MDEQELKPDATLQRIWEPIHWVWLSSLWHFEGEFGIQIPYEEAEKITTVQTAIDYMANIVGETA